MYVEPWVWKCGGFMTWVIVSFGRWLKRGKRGRGGEGMNEGDGKGKGVRNGVSVRERGNRGGKRE